MEILNQILAFVQDQSVALVLALVLPFVWKYFPAFRNKPNEICTAIAAIFATLANLLAPPEAHAGFLGGVLSGVLSPVAAVVLGTLDAVITRKFHDLILNPMYKAVGLKKPAPSNPG